MRDDDGNLIKNAHIIGTIKVLITYNTNLYFLINFCVENTETFVPQNPANFRI